MANLKFKIRPVIIQGDDLASVISSDSDTAITYNNYYPAGTHVSTYRIEAKLALSNVTVHDDLSISFDYGGTPDGQTLIKTHNGQAENDLAGGV